MLELGGFYAYPSYIFNPLFCILNAPPSRGVFFVHKNYKSASNCWNTVFGSGDFVISMVTVC